MSYIEGANLPDDHRGKPEEEPREPSPSSSDQAEAMRQGDTVLPIPDVGQRLHATVRQIGEETAFLDYGGRSEALIETKHLRGADGTILVQEGETIEAYVIANEEAVVLAPSVTPSANESLRDLRTAHQAAIPVQGKVIRVNAGGLEIDLSGNRAFCPLSQIDITHCPDASVFVGQTLDFRILEFGDMGRRIVVSRRALLLQRREEMAARVRASLQAGEERDGKVVRIEPFGAFIDLGGIDGMVHISEISHDRVTHPSQALNVGDTVRVKVLEVGKDPKGRDRISLSIKAALQDPWVRAAEEIHEGQTLTGQVARLADFGAFIRLLPGIDGLLHFSEVHAEGGANPRDSLKEGQEIQVRVQKVDARRRRISLSIRDETPASHPATRIGETYEGLIRAHKPYGVFVDLPSLGDRQSGLLPLEETGVSRPAELAKRFRVGDKIDVVVQQVDEKGRIRLAIPTGSAGTLPKQPTARAAAGAMADAFRRALEGKQLKEKDQAGP